MFIIPAIDIIGGKCVRLTRGDYNQKKIYNENPLEVAKEFEGIGIERLHLVDLDGAKAKHIINWKVLERIATKTNLVIDFGGGIQSNEDISIAFNSGAHQITGGSIAVKQPTLFESWLEKYGAERIILGADCQNEHIAIHGWQKTTDLNIFAFLENYIQKGVLYTICTDISKDGMLQGTAIELYKKIRTQFPDLKLIASGGISSMEDLTALNEIGCYGAIIGKAIYEKTIPLENLIGNDKKII